MTPYLFCAAWVIIHWAMGMEVCFTPDSGGYIHFGTSRTAGYPLFLWIIKSITGSYKWLPHIQLSLVWTSVGYVAHGLPRHLRWPWVLGMVAISFANKQINCMEIMTEPLFITILLTIAGIILHRSSIFLLALCVGALILIRPSSYALLPGFFFYIWQQKQSWIKGILPIVGCILLGIGAQGMCNGVWSTQSFLGINLIGKIAFVVRPDMNSKNLDEATLIKHMGEYMHPIQQAVDQSHSSPIRYYLAAIIYDTVRFKQLTKLESSLSIPAPNHDTFWRNTAIQIIKQNPLGYIQDVWMNWQALWFVWDLLPEEQRIIRAQQAEAISYQFPEFSFDRLEHKSRLPIMVYALRGGLALVLFLSLWSIFCTPWWRRSTPAHPHNVTTCTLSLMMHGPILLTALLQAGLPRYVLIFWPYFGLITLLWLGRLYEQRCRSHSML